MMFLINRAADWGSSDNLGELVYGFLLVSSLLVIYCLLLICSAYSMEISFGCSSTGAGSFGKLSFSTPSLNSALISVSLR